MKAKLAQRSPARAAAQRRSAEPLRRPGHPGGVDAVTILRLQAAAGNQAVGGLLAQRAVDYPPPPAPLVTPSPEEFGDFQVVAGRVGQTARTLQVHPPARSKVAEADWAATGPTNEVRSQGAAAQVAQMGLQKPGAFDKVAFVAAVKVAVDRATPKTMEEVDGFSSSGKPGKLKDQVVGEVAKGKDGAAAGIKAASDAAPDTSHGSPKAVTPMGPESPGAVPADARAEEAMPAPKPEDQVGLGYTKCTTDGRLEEAHITPEQVGESNEPQFQEAIAAKHEADQHAETAPQQFRQDEQAQLEQSKSDADAAARGGLGEMHQARGSAFASVGGHKDREKGKNEAERAKVATQIEAVYAATKKDVDELLAGLDIKVGDAFNSGEAAAREAFESSYKARKDAYFEKRYRGWLGHGRWLKDKLLSPPDEVNGFIEEAKQVYQARMAGVIDQVATIVQAELGRATQRIADGRQQIRDCVTSQPRNLRQAAQQAAAEISGRFDQLEQDVSARGTALVDDLAQKYIAAAQAVDARCAAMREENKGLLDKAMDGITGMIDAIGRVKDLLASLAEKVAGVVGDIIAHPIAFLGNLVGAVKQGFGQFVDHIWTYLKQGLLGWLFGEVAKTGLEMPEAFDLKGILKLVAQVLGLTWENIRARAVAVLGARMVGVLEKGEAAVEKAAEIYNLIKGEGLAGVWHLIEDKVSEIKDRVLDAVGGMVVDEVITAGVKWVLGLLNPASAFIKACMAIYDIVTFFLHHGEQIADVVNAVMDNLAAIVAGNVGAAAGRVENALARTIPLAIGFLASLLGLGDLGEKVKGVLEKVREPVNGAVDWVLGNVIKPVLGAVAGGAEREARSPEERKAALDSAMSEGQALLNDPAVTVADVEQKLPDIKSRHQVKTLELVVDAQKGSRDTVHIEGANSPRRRGPAVVIAGGGGAPPGPLPARRWLPTEYRRGKEIRKNMYDEPAGWKTFSEKYRSLFREHVLELVEDINSRPKADGLRALQNYVGLDILPAGWVDLYQRDGRLTREGVEFWIQARTARRMGTWDVDHDLSLAQHWSLRQGNDVDQNARNAIATDPRNLAFVLAGPNRSWGSRDASGQTVPYVGWVGPGFQSDLESQDRRTFKGQPYTLDEAGSHPIP